MPDRDDTEIPGSITEKADAHDRMADISNVNKTISEMQKKTQEKINETRRDTGELEGIQEVQNSMVKVLSSLNKTVGSVGYGFSKIAADTAKASGELISSYGKTISQDINVNKQNVVAMALARSTPLFGYFAAKFMETDVYQKAKERMKSSIADALGSVTNRFKEGFSSIFKKKGKETEGKSLQAKAKEEIPKMQKGGYVEKGGLAQLHPAEVVVPIDKILEKIDETISITQDLAKISKRAQLNTLDKMSTFFQEVKEREKVGVVKGFMRSLREVHKQHTEPSNLRMLRAVLAIQDQIGATVGTWPQVWQKMLINHPTFRNIVFGIRTLTNVLGLPGKLVYQIFKTRGGYSAQLSHDKNPMKAAAENIGLVYAEGMWRLDNIAKFTRATAEATRDISSSITGKKYPALEGVGRGFFSLIGLANSLTKGFLKYTPAVIEGVFAKLLKEDFGEAWTRGLGAGEILIKPWTIVGNLQDKIGNLLDMLPRRAEMKGIYGKAAKAKEAEEPTKLSLIKGNKTVSRELLEQINQIQENTQKIVNIAADEYYIQEKMAVGFFGSVGGGTGFGKSSKKSFKEHTSGIENKITKLLSVAADEYEVTQEMNKREERRTAFSFISGIFNAGKGFLGNIFGALKGGLGGLLSLIGFGGMGGMLKKFFQATISSGVKGGLLGAFKKLFPKGLITGLSKALGTVFSTVWIKQIPKLAGKITGPLLGAIKGIPGLIKGVPSAIKGIGPTVASSVSKLAPLLSGIGPKILEATKSLGSTLAGVMKSPVIWKAAAAAGAFKVGWEVGQYLDKTLGISEKFKGLLNKWDEKAKKQMEKVQKETVSLREKAMKGGEEGRKAAFGVKALTHIGKFAEQRREAVGFFGRAHMLAIDEAQRQYILDNIEDYTKYAPADLAVLREKWLKEGGYKGKAMGMDAERYGTLREKAFHAYLKKNAPKFFPKVKAGADYHAKQTFRTIDEKTGGALTTTAELAERGVGMTKAGIEAQRKALEVTTEKATKAYQGVGEFLGQNIRQTSMLVNNSINNVQRTVNTGMNQKEYFGDYAGSVLRGDLD